MTETTHTSNSAPLVTALVTSGEHLFTSLSGRSMDENQQKISDGITSLFDGFLPTLESKASFDLAGLLNGLTDTFNGLAKTINSTKTKTSQAGSTTINETEHQA